MLWVNTARRSNKFCCKYLASKKEHLNMDFAILKLEILITDLTNFVAKL